MRRVPLGFGGSSSTSVEVEGYVAGQGRGAPGATSTTSGPGYFSLMRSGSSSGREITADDREDAPGVAVVNETMAARYWPGREAVGGRFRLGEKWITVVGVARDATYRDLGEKAAPWFFLPLFQGYRPDMTLLLRTAGDPAALAGPAKSLVRQLDPGIAPYSVTTLQAFIGASDFRQRVGSQLLGLFGVLGLLLASIGLYGVLSFQVARRTREIGIRMALGSSRGEVLGLVLRQGAVLVGLGLAIGIVARRRARAAPAQPAARPAPLGPAGLRRCGRGCCFWRRFVACLVPARRATRVDPLARAAPRMKSLGRPSPQRAVGGELTMESGGLVMATLTLSDEFSRVLAPDARAESPWSQVAARSPTSAS